MLAQLAADFVWILASNPFDWFWRANPLASVLNQEWVIRRSCRRSRMTVVSSINGHLVSFANVPEAVLSMA